MSPPIAYLALLTKTIAPKVATTKAIAPINTGVPVCGNFVIGFPSVPVGVVGFVGFLSGSFDGSFSSSPGFLSSSGVFISSAFIVTCVFANVSLVFASKDVYFYSPFVFGTIQLVVIVASIFMVMYGKEGCAIHDKLAHTKVIKI